LYATFSPRNHAQNARFHRSKKNPSNTTEAPASHQIKDPELGTDAGKGIAGESAADA